MEIGLARNPQQHAALISDHGRFRTVSKDLLSALENSPLLLSSGDRDLVIKITLFNSFIFHNSPQKNYLLLHFTEEGMKVKKSKCTVELAFEPRQSYSRAFLLKLCHITTVPLTGKSNTDDTQQQR